MDAVLNVAGTIGAIWLAVSILVAVAWALGGKRIFRKPPKPPIKIEVPRGADMQDVTDRVVAELERRDRMNGRGF